MQSLRKIGRVFEGLRPLSQFTQTNTIERSLIPQIPLSKQLDTPKQAIVSLPIKEALQKIHSQFPNVYAKLLSIIFPLPSSAPT